MAVTGWITAGTGTGWFESNNITARDGVEASVTGIGLTTSNNVPLLATNFGFSVSGTITGIEVRIRKRGTNQFSTFFTKDEEIMLYDSSTIGTNKATATNWPAALTDTTYGGTTDTWGATLTPASVNSSNFGVSIKAKTDHASFATLAYIDSVEIQITYTPDVGGDQTISVNTDNIIQTDHSVLIQTADVITGWIAPSSVSQVADGTSVSWDNLNNALTNNNVFANTGSDDNIEDSHLIQSSYDLSIIPDNATILGIELRFRKRGSNYFSVEFNQDTKVRLNSTPLGLSTNKAQTAVDWLETVHDTFYGGVTDTWGYSSLTGADLKDASFKSEVGTTCVENLEYCIAYVDVVEIQIHYTTLSTSNITVDTDVIIQSEYDVTIIGAAEPTPTVNIQQYSFDNVGTGYTFGLGTPVDSSKSFARLLSSASLSGGPTASTGNQTAITSGMTVELTDDNITLNRSSGAGIDNQLASVEVIEYIGTEGGNDEWRVIKQGLVTLSSSTTTTVTLSGVSDANKIVPWITGQRSDQSSASLSPMRVSARLTANDTVTFERVSSAGVVVVSYAIVEYIGSNWNVRHAREITTTATQAISQNTLYSDYQLTNASGISDWNDAFIVSSYGGIDDVGIDSMSHYTAPGSTTSTVAHDLFSVATVGAIINSHVVENANMTVEHLTLTDPGTADADWSETISTVSDLAQTQPIVYLHSSGGGSAHLRGSRLYELTDESTLRIWGHRTGNNLELKASIAVYPTELPYTGPQDEVVLVDTDIIDQTDNTVSIIQPNDITVNSDTQSQTDYNITVIQPNDITVNIDTHDHIDRIVSIIQPNDITVNSDNQSQTEYSVIIPDNNIVSTDWLNVGSVARTSAWTFTEDMTGPGTDGYVGTGLSTGHNLSFYRFDDHNINLKNTLVGLEFRVSRWTDGVITDHNIQLKVDSITVGDNKDNGIWPNSREDTIYGGADDLWNSNVTLAHLQDDSRNVFEIKFYVDPTDNPTAYLDYELVNHQPAIRLYYIENVVELSTDTQSQTDHDLLIIQPNDITVNVDTQSQTDYDITVIQPNDITVNVDTQTQTDYNVSIIQPNDITVNVDTQTQTDYSITVIQPNNITVNVDTQTQTDYNVSIIQPNDITVNSDNQSHTDYSITVIQPNDITVNSDNQSQTDYNVVIPEDIGIQVDTQSQTDYSVSIIQPNDITVNSDNQSQTDYSVIVEQTDQVIELLSDTQLHSDYDITVIQPNTVIVSQDIQSQNDYNISIIQPNDIDILSDIQTQTDNNISIEHINDITIEYDIQTQVENDLFIKTEGLLANGSVSIIETSYRLNADNSISIISSETTHNIDYIIRSVIPINDISSVVIKVVSNKDASNEEAYTYIDIDSSDIIIQDVEQTNITL